MRIEQAKGGTNRSGVPASAFAMPTDLRMRYDAPAPELADCVSGYAIYVCAHSEPMTNWYLPAPGMIVVLLDAGAVSVQFRHRRDVDVPRASVWGPTTHAFRTTTHGGISVGIGLTAEGWSRLTRLSARGSRDRVVALSEIVDPAAANALVAALEALDCDAAIGPTLDRLLAPLFRDATPDDVQVRALGRLIHADGIIGVEDVARRLGLDTRALRRLSTDRLGMPVRALLTRARFVRSYAAWLIGGEAPSYAGIDSSYFDEAHFLRDARTYLGTTPRRLDDRDTIYLRASLRARAAVMGAAAHVLHDAA